MAELFKLLLELPIMLPEAGYVDIPAEQSEMAMAATTAESKGIEPVFEEAKQRADWPFWRKAIEEEIKTLMQAGTWELVPRPMDQNMIGFK